MRHETLKQLLEFVVKAQFFYSYHAQKQEEILIAEIKKYADANENSWTFENRFNLICKILSVKPYDMSVLGLLSTTIQNMLEALPYPKINDESLLDRLIRFEKSGEHRHWFKSFFSIIDSYISDILLLKNDKLFKDVINFSSENWRFLSYQQRLLLIYQVLVFFSHDHIEVASTGNRSDPSNLEISFNPIIGFSVQLKKAKNTRTEKRAVIRIVMDLIANLFPEKLNLYGNESLAEEELIVIKAVNLMIKELDDESSLDQILFFSKSISEAIPHHQDELITLIAKSFNTKKISDDFYELTQRVGFFEQISIQTKEKIARLSKRDLNRISKIIHQLYKDHLLNLDSFMETIKRVTLRFPTSKATEVECQKDDFSITMINKSNNSRFHKGRSAEIAYKKMDDNSLFTSKFFNSDDKYGGRIYSDTHSVTLFQESRHRSARKEIKYHRFFNKESESFYCLENKLISITSFVFLPFYPGVSLDYLKYGEFIIGLLLFQSILDKVNDLHKSIRIHADLFPRNVIVNIETRKAHLIDFELTHRSGSNFVSDQYKTRCLSTTEETQHLMSDEQQTTILDSLFSDYMYLKAKENKEELERIIKDGKFKNALVVAIYIKYLQQSQCNTQRLLDFTTQIVSKYSRITAAEINQTADQILFNPTLTVEDSIRMAL